ncbi:MAG: AraC family transcriptional regulator [Anaerocolumna sp.]
MFNILIAEDEYLIRERLKNMLDYTLFGFKIIHDVDNGKDAYDFILKEKPNLAILDIKMPLLTGLEIAEKVHAEGLDTKIVILTSYDYFTFAQLSIKYGVFAYLLKPINKNELKSLLIQVRDEIVKLNQLTNIVVSYQTEWKEKMFLNYISNETLDFEGISCIQSILNPVNESFTLMGLFKIENKDGEADITDKVQKILEKQSIFSSSFFFRYTDNILGILIYELFSPKFSIQIANLQNQLVKSYDYSINIVINSQKIEMTNLPNIFNDTLNSLQNTVFLGKNIIVYINNSLSKTNNTFRYHCNIRDSLLLNLRMGDIVSINHILESAFMDLKEGSPSYNNLNILLSELLLTCNLYINEVNSNTNDNISFYIHELLENYIFLDDIVLWCKEYIENIYSNNNNFLNNATQVLIRKVQHIIESSYSNITLDLNYISEEVGYSPSYLSGTFKKVTGVSIVQYITKCRMEAAQKLLLKSKIKLTDLCEMVGYSDSFYFSKRFKSFFGYSPSEYIIAIDSKH